ncbi:hypothetical protein Pla123a_46810 [Posidoniimonas polymericola]|uniref:GHMP kinase C-terminal domain-containing protein n=1 Tax=Posidoniimonas polymericola TaxID=2528002 RepID=A0A5C5XSS1_9BACT|nr:beta-RFAP synthase [Posidoniimonas polymericola]TWT66287.1 hypothetical protein Pla123a_46810 [Posidoniimonas polymericola]
MTTPLAVEVRAPSRLHFGLFSFNDPRCPLSYGGVGAMVDTPGVRLNVAVDDRVVVPDGPLAARVGELAERVLNQPGISINGCHAELEGEPRHHIGLGVGTQLGMSVAAGLFALSGRGSSSADQLAAASGRGQRSAIGAHGFCRGGLLIDGGHQRPGVLGSLAQREDLPNEWRFVLVIPIGETGLANESERRAFASLPAPSEATTRRLHQLAVAELAPAAAESDYERFAESLYDYGLTAGGCFGPVQGGPFATTAIERRVDLIRSLGFPGCGQSSWGPTVYALAPDEASAKRLVDLLGAEPAAERCELIVAAPCNTGAEVRPTYSRP